MQIAYTIARILTGLLFIVIGANVFFWYMPPPPANEFPHNALLWNQAMFASHFIWFTGGVQTICGILLLINRFVTLALVVLSAVLANIIVFHVTMWPAGLPMALIAVVLWFVTAWPLRSRFAILFSAR